MIKTRLCTGLLWLVSLVWLVRWLETKEEPTNEDEEREKVEKEQEQDKTIYWAFVDEFPL